MFHFSVVTAMFSNFQATFPLISPEVFGIVTPNFTTKVRKIWLNFWNQNQSGLKENSGMMLWMMSGIFTFSFNLENKRWKMGNFCLVAGIWSDNIVSSGWKQTTIKIYHPMKIAFFFFLYILCSFIFWVVDGSKLQ